MKITRTFNYTHPTAGPIQHKGVEVIEHETKGPHLHIVFTDHDGDRQITIDTNAVYALREEIVEDPPPATLIGDTGRPS